MLIFWLLAAMLAFFGWSGQWSLQPEAVLYVWHWRDDSTDPQVYAVMDSTAVVRLGDCISFRDAQGADRVLCRNYRIRGVKQRREQADMELIPAYMKEGGATARAVPTGDDEQDKPKTDQL